MEEHEIPTPLREVARAHAWEVANPVRRKTTRGRPRYLDAWLARCQDGGGRARGPQREHHSAIDDEVLKLQERIADMRGASCRRKREIHERRACPIRVRAT